MSKIQKKHVFPNCKGIIPNGAKKCTVCGNIFSDCFKTPDKLFGIQKRAVGFLPYLLLFILFTASLIISDINRGKKSFIDNFKPAHNQFQAKTKEIPSFKIVEKREPSPDNFDYYMRNLQRQLRKNWHPPEIEASTKVTVYFEVKRDGNIKSMMILKSSGFKRLDEAALNAVRYAVPYPPFPSGYTKDTLNIQFDFVYNANHKNKEPN